MKKTISIICFLLVSIIAFAQNDTLNQTDPLGKKQGKWIENYKDGNIKYSGQFKDDQPIGVFKYYNENGDMTAVLYHTGKNNRTIANIYHPNGQMMGMGVYKNKEKDSTWQYFDMYGNKASEEFYVKGKKEGEVKSYYDNGAVAEIKYYKNDLEEGLAKQFFEDGSLKDETNYKAGKKHGAFTQYYPNGNKKMTGNYDMNVRTGKWVHYMPSGLTEAQEVYEEGKVIKRRIDNGQEKTYYKSGNLHTVVTWKNGKKEGEFVEYFNNGKEVKKPFKINEEYGAPDMKAETVGQTIKRKGMYANGVLHGKMYHYNEFGKVINTENYVNGALAEGK